MRSSTDSKLLEFKRVHVRFGQQSVLRDTSFPSFLRRLFDVDAAGCGAASTPAAETLAFMLCGLLSPIKLESFSITAAAAATRLFIVLVL